MCNVDRVYSFCTFENQVGNEVRLVGDTGRLCRDDEIELHMPFIGHADKDQSELQQPTTMAHQICCGFAIFL